MSRTRYARYPATLWKAESQSEAKLSSKERPSTKSLAERARRFSIGRGRRKKTRSNGLERTDSGSWELGVGREREREKARNDEMTAVDGRFVK